MIFPGFENIYTLEDPISNVWFRAQLEHDDAIKQAFELVRKEFKPNTPIEAGYQMGSNKKIADIIWTSSVAPLIVSERFINLLKSGSFKGWDKYKIKLLDKEKEEIHNYYGLSITGRCGSIDDSKSEKIMVNYPAGKFPNYKGLYFSPTSWDGSDLFMTEDRTGWIFVTDRVKKALEGINIQNVKITPVTKVIRSKL